MHTFVPQPSASDIEVTIAKLKGINHQVFIVTPEELIQVVGETFGSEIHKLIKLIWKEEKLPRQWKESVVLPINRKGDKTDCSSYRIVSLL
jgi:hypothetical protein